MFMSLSTYREIQAAVSDPSVIDILCITLSSLRVYWATHFLGRHLASDIPVYSYHLWFLAFESIEFARKARECKSFILPLDNLVSGGFVDHKSSSCHQKIYHIIIISFSLCIYDITLNVCIYISDDRIIICKLKINLTFPNIVYIWFSLEQELPHNFF